MEPIRKTCAIEHLRRVALGLACALAAAACGQDADPAEARQAATPRAPARPGEDQTVTLLTGDRVTLRDGMPLVTPAADRAQVRFSIQRDRDRVLVIPGDVAPLIAAGRLDVALFDVTELLAAGYGDAARSDLPLIVTGATDAPGLARGLATGVIVDRAMPALHALAVRQPKARAGAALASLRSLAPDARGVPTKLWLDRRRKPLLDHSVPQIGGSVAHARGFTGTGITVAVLDTGIDSTHPDLAGKVTAAEEFVGDGLGVLDVLGHATHVASIIAGTGAASNGQFAGVAPDAQLISGRVCGGFDCPDSAMLAGMEWAVVEQHAKIVNISIGGTDAPGLDPLEDAVDQLSAQYGTLFVIAAGNDGDDATIESPGSADAALTVGAVDRDDQLAAFSSRGPRAGDHAVKPDLTAPGVDIVAARATTAPPIGDPVGASYMRLSGTSMATPHVAGAAALLLQQHPDWSGAQLKAQLIGTAVPNPALTVFAQGAGRVDLDRGTRQDVSADPASLSLGIASFPHGDDPAIVRTVTYHNGGAAPITLALTASLAHDLVAAPGMIAVEPAALAIAAGASASAVVTVHTDGALTDGLYGGALVATAGDVRVETAIGVEREAESFDLTLDSRNVDGTPSFSFVFVAPLGHRSKLVLFTGTTTLRLPRGGYAIDASLQESFLTAPRFQLTADTTLVLDSAVARPIHVDVGHPGLTTTVQGFQYSDTPNRHVSGSAASGLPLLGLQLGPDVPPGELVGWAFETLTDDVRFGTPKTVYNLAHRERGHLPSGWTETVSPNQLATVDARHAGQDDVLYDKGAVAVVDDGANGLLATFIRVPDSYLGPFARTELFFGTGFHWLHTFDDNRVLPEEPEFPSLAVDLQTLRSYHGGQHVLERWNQGAFGPAFAAIPLGVGGVLQNASTASRTGDQLLLLASMTTDATVPAHLSETVFDHQRMSLFRDGVLIGEQLDVFGGAPFDVPPEPATYRFEQDTTRAPGVFALAPHVTAAWTFHSQHVGGTLPQSLPLVSLRFAPALDDHNQTAARIAVVPVTFERPPFAATPPIVSASVECSFDDGAHWTHVPLAVLGDRAIAVIVHPRGAAFVSLRGRARDLLGNAVEQTVIRAYGLAPR